MKYVIEHLSNKIYKWSLLEYKHASEFIGKKDLLITNVPSKSLKEISKLAVAYKESIFNLNLGKGCILDPYAKETLKPKDAEKFDFLLFGGILGDNPPQARTREFLSKKLKFPARNLGKIQMPTNVAVIVAKMIIDGKSLEQIEFIDNLEIKVSKKLSIELPYRYVAQNGKPLLPDYLLNFIKKRQSI